MDYDDRWARPRKSWMSRSTWPGRPVYQVSYERFSYFTQFSTQLLAWNAWSQHALNRQLSASPPWLYSIIQCMVVRSSLSGVPEYDNFISLQMGVLGKCWNFCDYKWWRQTVPPFVSRVNCYARLSCSIFFYCGQIYDSFANPFPGLFDTAMGIESPWSRELWLQPLKPRLNGALWQFITALGNFDRRTISQEELCKRWNTWDTKTDGSEIAPLLCRALSVCVFSLSSAYRFVSYVFFFSFMYIYFFMCVCVPCACVAFFTLNLLSLRCACPYL